MVNGGVRHGGAILVSVLALALGGCAISSGGLVTAMAEGDDAQVYTLIEGSPELTGRAPLLKVPVEDADVLHWHSSPLHFAAWIGRTDYTAASLNAGAAIDLTDRDGATPLHLAAGRGHMPVVELLVERGARIDARDDARQTPLHHASRGQQVQVQVLDYLLANSADVNAQADDQATPLLYAADAGHTAMVATLLAAGGDAERAGGRWAATPLHRAAAGGHLDVLRLLIDRGVSLDTPDSTTETPLHDAVRGGDVAVVEALLVAGADANRQGGRYQATPLQQAASLGQLSMVQALLRYDVALDRRDSTGEMALHDAARNGHVEVVQALLDAGADVRPHGGRFNATPLHAAARAGHVEVVKMLLEHGAPLDAPDSASEVPLHDAVRGGNAEVVAALIAAGASPHVSNGQGQTPAVLAQAMGKPHLGAVLAGAAPGVDLRTAALAAPQVGVDHLVIAGSGGAFMCPYTTDGVTAEWVNQAINARTGGTLGSAVGGAVGAYAANRALEAVPFGSLLGGMFGSRAGRALGRSMAIDENLLRQSSDQSFNSLNDMARYLVVRHAGNGNFNEVVEAAESVYPGLKAAVVAAAR